MYISTIALIRSKKKSQLLFDMFHNSPRVYMSFQLDTLSRFKASQSILELINAACLVQKHQNQFKVFGLTRSGSEPKIFTFLLIILSVEILWKIIKIFPSLIPSGIEI